MKKLLLLLVLCGCGNPYQAIFCIKGRATITHVETGREYEAVMWEPGGKFVKIWTEDGRMLVLPHPVILERTR